MPADVPTGASTAHTGAAALAGVEPVVGVAKPDEEFFRRVAGELGVELRELVFVDDTLENVHAAQACGLPAVFWHHRDGVDTLRAQLAAYGVEVG